jgi:hypothetical protein
MTAKRPGNYRAWQVSFEVTGKNILGGGGRGPTNLEGEFGRWDQRRGSFKLPGPYDVL